MVLIRAGPGSDAGSWTVLLLEATAVEVLPAFPPDASLCRCLSNRSCSICARPDKTGGSAVGTDATVGSSVGFSFFSSDSTSGLAVARAGVCSFIEAANALLVREDQACRMAGKHSLGQHPSFIFWRLFTPLSLWRSRFFFRHGDRSTKFLVISAVPFEGYARWCLIVMLLSGESKYPAP